MLELSRVLPILCQFGIGAALGVIGIRAGVTGGYLNLQLSHHRQMVWVLIGGYAALLALSCAFTFWLPFAGGEAAP